MNVRAASFSLNKAKPRPESRCLCTLLEREENRDGGVEQEGDPLASPCPGSQGCACKVPDRAGPRGQPEGAAAT